MMASKSRNTAATRAWALDTANASVRVKPRRPYTPYNLFYLLERELVVQGNDPATSKERATKKAKMLESDRSKYGKRVEDDIPMPQRYNGIVMLPMWYEPNLKEKRKHRKTHGTISFKDLTGMISKSWSTIDPETKSYCTKISEFGRKRYKEQMVRFNASQKIIQLKKEQAAAAMRNARDKRIEPFHLNGRTGSPPRAGKSEKDAVVTPDRILSHQAPIVSKAQPSKAPPIVTPPNHNGSNNRVPMFIPSGSHPFHHYGPPPPLPPPMPRSMMAGQPPPPPMPMYGKYQRHQHLQRQHQIPQYNTYQYPPAPATSKAKQAVKTSKGAAKTTTKISRQTGGSRPGIIFSNMPKSAGVGETMDVKVSVNKEQHASSPRQEKHDMTQDEARRICNLMGQPATPDQKADRFATSPSYPDNMLRGIREIPSFDLAEHIGNFGVSPGDHHSLSDTPKDNNDCDLSRDMSVGGITDFHYEDQNIMEFIRGDLAPLGLEEFHDFHTEHDFHNQVHRHTDAL